MLKKKSKSGSAAAGASETVDQAVVLTHMQVKLLLPSRNIF